MAKSYPRISKLSKYPKHWTRGKGHCRCGNIGTYTATIEYNYMRGDDDVVAVCDEHKHNLEFLLNKGESNG
jgi:hypothetical protein